MSTTNIESTPLHLAAAKGLLDFILSNATRNHGKTAKDIAIGSIKILLEGLLDFKSSNKILGNGRTKDLSKPELAYSPVATALPIATSSLSPADAPANFASMISSVSEIKKLHNYIAFQIYCIHSFDNELDPLYLTF